MVEKWNFKGGGKFFVVGGATRSSCRAITNGRIKTKSADTPALSCPLSYKLPYTY